MVRITQKPGVDALGRPFQPVFEKWSDSHGSQEGGWIPCPGTEWYPRYSSESDEKFARRFAAVKAERDRLREIVKNQA